MKKILLTVLGIFCLNIAMAQIRVTGTITGSDDGAPIPMASVMIKGNTRLITSADVNGNYILANVPGNGVLVVSSVGYTSQEIPINNRNVINVVLAPDAAMLEEVMVVAYGTAKKGSYTGAASVVKQEAIKDVPAISFEGTLTGRVAGLQFAGGSGQAGSSSNVRIRGIGSMNASNEPLYVIDGVPVVTGDYSQLSYVSSSVMNTLNPADIESITVLKDAAASSLYGSRAANGVIVITTKKGKEGKMSINFKATVGITPAFAYNNWKPATPEQQRELVLEMYRNQQLDQGKSTTDAQTYAETKLNSDMPMDPRGFFDWENAYLRTAVYQNYDLSVRGGNESFKYFSSFGYAQEQGRVYANSYDRINGRLNVSAKLLKNLTLESSVAVSSTYKDGFNDSYNNGFNYFLQIRNLLLPEYWPTNTDGTPVTTRYKSYAYNNLYYNDLQENDSRAFKTTFNENLKWNILPTLTASSIFSYDVTRVDDHVYRSPLHFDATSVNGRVHEYSTKIQKVVSSSTLNWAETFADVHNVNVLAGFEVETNDVFYLRSSGTNLPNATSKTVATAGVKDATAYNYGNSIMSFLSKAEYSYNNKYYLSGSFRRDGSSRLGPNTRWGNFWSVAGSWRLKNESFLRDVSWLTNLQLRGSYGVNGTLPSSNYGHMSLYGYGVNYNGNPGGEVSNVADSNLSWETNYMYNLAVEASLFEGRLSATVEYFNRDSKNLLQTVQISRVTGFSGILTNYGAMNNRGLELELGGDIVKNKDWKWYLGINASFIKSKVTKLYDKAPIIWTAGGDSEGRFIYKEGFSPRSFYGKEWAGVDPANGKPMYFTNNTTTPVDNTVDGRPVTYTHSLASEVITGCADPDVYGGINTNLSWKGLSLDMSFVYSMGGDAYNSFERYVNDDGYFSNRIRTEKAMDRWQQPGDQSVNPRRVYDASYGMVAHQSRWLYKDHNYLRLKSATLSYTLPKTWAQKAGMSSVRVYASGTNLLTFANENYFDPEVNVYGFLTWQMPIGKTYTFGLEIGF